MDKDVRRDPGHTEAPQRPSLGRAVLLGYYKSYPSSRIRHFCNSQWYLLLLEQMRRQGILSEAEAWFVSDVAQQFVEHNVLVRTFVSFDDMAAQAKATDVLWVRGKIPAYIPVLSRIAARLRVYYAASKRLVPREWNHFDCILVDDERQLEPVSHL